MERKDLVLALARRRGVLTWAVQAGRPLTPIVTLPRGRSPWIWTVDGVANVVTENATSDPTHPVPDSLWQPTSALPSPLALTWSATKGSDVSWVPVAFTESLRIGLGRTHYGTGYCNLHLIAPDVPLSRPLQPWSTAVRPSVETLELLQRAGTDLIPLWQPGLRVLNGSGGGLRRSSGSLLPSDEGRHPTGPSTRQRSGRVAYTDQNGTVEVATIRLGPGESGAVIKTLSFTVAAADAPSLDHVSLAITWDNREAPSVLAPLPNFFGAGTLSQGDGAGGEPKNGNFLVQGLTSYIRWDATGTGGALEVRLAAFWPMPFRSSAVLQLQTSSDGGGLPRSIPALRWSVGYAITPSPHPPHTPLFHATYSDHPTPVAGRDVTMLDTKGTEGVEEWSGHVVGTVVTFSRSGDLKTLEGDPRFYFDDSGTPQVQGTGTEEWGGGGDYWQGGERNTLPLAGHPNGGGTAAPIESMYRFLVPDLMPFGFRAVVGIEHGGTDESVDHYQTLVHWYGHPEPVLIQTDFVDVGNRSDEAMHNYSWAGNLSAPYTLESRYERGVDTTANGIVVYPPSNKTGRRLCGGAVEFTVATAPTNVGMILRRTLDYGVPHQQANVSIRVNSRDTWTPVGVWYTAGSNAVAYSNPSSETGPITPTLEVSNRRFRDAEFLLSRLLTANATTVHVRIEHAGGSVLQPLWPGHVWPSGSACWADLDIAAFAYLLP